MAKDNRLFKSISTRNVLVQIMVLSNVTANLEVNHFFIQFNLFVKKYHNKNPC